MAKSKLNSFFRGDTVTYTLSFKDKDGTPIDISGHIFWFTLKTKLEDADAAAVFQKQITFPADTESQNGRGNLSLSSIETGDIPPGDYYYDFQKVIPGNPPIVYTYVRDKISVLQDVTRTDGS